MGNFKRVGFVMMNRRTHLFLLCPENFYFGGIIKSNCPSVRPCELCLEHIAYITLDGNTKLGTNVLLEKAMCHVQDPGLHLKGEGYNHRSKVKK